LNGSRPHCMTTCTKHGNRSDNRGPSGWQASETHNNRKHYREVAGSIRRFKGLLVCLKNRRSPSLASPSRNTQPLVKLVSRLPQLGQSQNRATAPSYQTSDRDKVKREVAGWAIFSHYLSLLFVGISLA
jgi:hypothetical protein